MQAEHLFVIYSPRKDRNLNGSVLISMVAFKERQVKVKLGSREDRVLDDCLLVFWWR